MALEIMILLIPGGFVLLYDGWRKWRKKEYFVHSPIGSWLLAIFPMFPLLRQREFLMEETPDTVTVALVVGALILLFGAVGYKTCYELTHRKINIHNMAKSRVEKIVESRLEKLGIAYEKDPDPTGKKLYTFEDSKGKITIETHLASNDHQVVTFSKINQIPKGPEVIEDLKEDVMDVERRFSKTIGIAELLSGMAMLGLALALIS